MYLELMALVWLWVCSGRQYHIIGISVKSKWDGIFQNIVFCCQKCLVDFSICVLQKILYSSNLIFWFCFQALHISAILDTEPEMDEYFVCTLFNPTGGARLGARVQTLITVLQNQAPLGLFSISAVENRYSLFIRKLSLLNL